MVSRRDLLAVLLAPRPGGQQAQSNMFADAKAYERFMGRWSRLIAPALVDFAEIPDSARVLDVGSGTGSLAIAIVCKHQRARVMGIDPSKEYIAYASSINPFPGRVEFQSGDA
jgi:ubiquinone/menaquinone biosynthesis C-methylase UbiE